VNTPSGVPGMGKLPPAIAQPEKPNADIGCMPGQDQPPPASPVDEAAEGSGWTASLSDAVFVFDHRHRYVYVNPAGEHLVGRPASAVLGRTLTELVADRTGFFGDNPDRSLLLERVLPETLAGGSLHDDETTVLLSDGSAGTYSLRLDPVWSGDNVTGAVLVMRDMTELSNATFQTVPVGMIRIRGDGKVLEVNRAFRAMLGLPGQGPLQQPFRSLVHPDERAAHDEMFAEFLEGGRYRYQAERQLVHADGSVVWCCVTMNVPYRRMLDNHQWFDRAVGLVEDITERKRLESELRTRNVELARMARTDPLTGLPNRHHLEERLHEAISYTRRHGGYLSIALLDVDHFKHINDRHGHQVGDEVLKAIAERLGDTKRTEDVCGRWGAEEFLVLLFQSDRGGATAFAERLRRAVSARPIIVADGTNISVTVSVGVASGSVAELDDLLRRADLAVHAAKGAGRDRVAAAGADRHPYTEQIQVN
jgi:diguanylate cyclase (GGDEF)-like protein/PAS domain S-box-containing protein